MDKLSLTLVILTKDEELNLEKCLKSVGSLPTQIVIVDSGSTDKTLEIAKKYKAEIYTHPFTTQADQFNWAVDTLKITGEWILRLDADEELLPELLHEIKEKLPLLSEEVKGVILSRRVYFMNRWIRHGGYYPTWLLRVFRTGAGRSEDREMDEHLILTSGVATKFTNDFIDNNQKGLKFWIAKHNNYSTREAYAEMKKYEIAVSTSLHAGQAERRRWLKEKIYARFPLFIRPFLYYFYRYILRLGFLDGMPGLIFHFLQGFWYRFLVDAKIYEIRKKKSLTLQRLAKDLRDKNNLKKI
jgi:glycosyltransferase involved in cell wall biosynthesis